jgi:protein-S-isoprenylcysteine O-methyltransferase Ste14
MGGWWYSAIFVALNLFFVLSSSRARIKRLIGFPRFQSKAERIVSYISVIFFSRGLIILTIFIPLNFHPLRFIIGTSLFLFCLWFYTRAMHDFLGTPENEPVTRGIYQKLRHPMQTIAVVMWIGVGISALSWLVIVACLIQFFISIPHLVAQERECLEIYGKSYKEYLTRVRRYYFF